MAILEESVRSEGPLALADVLAEVRRLKLDTPSEAGDLIRANRDTR